MHRLDRVAELAALDGPERQLLDRVEAVADRLERHQRTEQPGPQQTAAHGGHRAIELVEQRSGAAAFGSLQDLEVLQRRRIDEEVVGTLTEGDRSHVREIDLLRAAHVMHERAGGGHRRGMRVEAEPFEAGRAQLIEQRAARRLRVERPAVDRRDREAGRRDRRRHVRRSAAVTRFGRDDLARPQHDELVGERLQAVGPGIFGGGELARGQIEQRDADRVMQGEAFSLAARRP